MSTPSRRVRSYPVPMSAPVRRHVETTLGYAFANEVERRRRRRERNRVLVAIGFCLAALVYVVGHAIYAIVEGRLPIWGG